ncbi:hypothetical protein N6H18_07635 [Reichenbachiella agarivorans]|uniref:General stress protein CsbD n=1 Tax=Reichenbachiella agarivorans TaxID=2979464 RepID=A0ABY6CWJ0_9BACT|nr:hypothetical protein [Reichenbachiella agarivorans]UXP33818.1 hypothetical protein N6H18_07635 [Reichenbachiella agarivorans]
MTNIRSWRELKILLKWKFPVLSDEDFLHDEENKETVLVQLSNKLNKSRNELDLILSDLQNY